MLSPSSVFFVLVFFCPAVPGPEPGLRLRPPSSPQTLMISTESCPVRSFTGLPRGPRIIICVSVHVAAPHSPLRSRPITAAVSRDHRWCSSDQGGAFSGLCRKLLDQHPSLNLNPSQSQQNQTETRRKEASYPPILTFLFVLECTVMQRFFLIISAH